MYGLVPEEDRATWCWCWESNLGLLQELYALLTCEPTFQLPCLHFTMGVLLEFLPWLPLNDGLKYGILRWINPFLHWAVFGQDTLSLHQKWNRAPSLDGLLWGRSHRCPRPSSHLWTWDFVLLLCRAQLRAYEMVLLARVANLGGASPLCAAVLVPRSLIFYCFFVITV